MTTQESFKARVRARMSRTGERYNAARRVLIEQAETRSRATAPDPDDAATTTRTWVSDPETAEATLREATGRGWDEWCDLVDAWGGHDDGHSAIVAWLGDTHGLDGWWAQTVTVGWERITGRRLPHQRPDGTFSAGKTRTITTDHEVLRAMLLDDDDRGDLFGGDAPELRSRPTSKNVRLGMPSGTAELAMDPRDDGRVRIAVAHERLPTLDDVATWKEFWADWLAALDGA